MATEVTTDTFEREVLDYKGAVLVDLWADWCGPCRTVGQWLPAVEAALPNVKVVKVDFDKHRQLAEVLKVQSLPTLLVYVNGEMVGRSGNPGSPTALVRFVQDHV